MNAERIAELLHLFNDMAPIARTFGMRLAYDDKGQAIVSLPYNPALDHPMGGVHGGVYATLLDSAGWYTAAAAHDVACWLTTSEMSVHFLAAVQQTSLRAVGKLIKRGKRQDVVEVHLYDGEGHLVGHATGTFVLLTNLPLAPMPRPVAGGQ